MSLSSLSAPFIVPFVAEIDNHSLPILTHSLASLVHTIITCATSSFVAEGSPYYGFNESDPSLRYFNGTPAAVALWGLVDLDGSVKSFFGGEKVHLVTSGPNEGELGF